MKFKEMHFESQYKTLPQKLRDICDLFHKLSVSNGVIPTVTRVTDTVEGESGVHPNSRAVDFRNEYFNGTVRKRLYPIETVQQIVETINSKYPRTDGRVVCMHHSFRGGPFHFHIQIPYAWVTEEEREKLYGND